jgi:nucleoside-diphosphate-sugar epimerase
VINTAYMGDHDLSSNLQGIENLARACGRVGVERLIHMSTAVVVGRSREDVITEMTPCRPLAQYEKVKLAMEHELLSCTRGRVKVAILRPSEIFGEGGKGLVGLASELIAGLQWRAVIKDMVYARRKLNLVCVDNVVAALWFLASTDKEIDGQCFLVSDDDAVDCNYRDVVTILSSQLGLPQPAHARITCPAPLLSALLWATGKSNINPYRIYSCEKLRGYGFKKAVSFQDGLKRFAEWFKRSHITRLDA